MDENLDRFLDSLGIQIFGWQRDIFKTLVKKSKSEKLYLVMRRYDYATLHKQLEEILANVIGEKKHEN